MQPTVILDDQPAAQLKAWELVGSVRTAISPRR